MCRIMTFFILQLRSQHPYAETFVGHPLVYTINIWNKTEVTKTIKTILGKQVRGLSAKYWISILFNTRLLDTFFFTFQVKPFVPFEFSCEGMLEKLNAYIENQVRTTLSTTCNNMNSLKKFPSTPSAAKL